MEHRSFAAALVMGARPHRQARAGTNSCNLHDVELHIWLSQICYRPLIDSSLSQNQLPLARCEHQLAVVHRNPQSQPFVLPVPYA